MYARTSIHGYRANATSGTRQKHQKHRKHQKQRRASRVFFSRAHCLRGCVGRMAIKCAALTRCLLLYPDADNTIVDGCLELSKQFSIEVMLLRLCSAVQYSTVQCSLSNCTIRQTNDVSRRRSMGLRAESQPLFCALAYILSLSPHCSVPFNFVREHHYVCAE